MQNIIYGNTPSKSNCYQIIKTTSYRPGKKDFYSLGKTQALNKYEESFFMQCAIRGRMTDKRFRLDIDVYYSSDRPDLDNALKVILDCLQSCKAIKNDRLCSEIHARKLIDKDRPRIEFEITELL